MLKLEANRNNNSYDITSNLVVCYTSSQMRKFRSNVVKYGLMIAEVAAVAVGVAEEASVIEATAQTASIHVIEEEEAEVATVGETGD